MSEVVTAPAPAVKLPPAARIPKLFQGFGFAMSRRWMIQRLARRYGDRDVADPRSYGGLGRTEPTTGEGVVAGECRVSS